MDAASHLVAPPATDGNETANYWCHTCEKAVQAARERSDSESSLSLSDRSKTSLVCSECHRPYIEEMEEHRRDQQARRATTPAPSPSSAPSQPHPPRAAYPAFQPFNPFARLGLFTPAQQQLVSMPVMTAPMNFPFPPPLPPPFFGSSFAPLPMSMPPIFGGLGNYAFNEAHFQSLLNGLMAGHAGHTNTTPTPQSVVDSLHRFPVDRAWLDAHPGADCVICVADFEESETLTEFPCHHHFHSQCIAPWLERANKCPTCRANIG